MRIVVAAFKVPGAMVAIVATVAIEAVTTFLALYDAFPILKQEQPQRRRRATSPREKAALYHQQRGRCHGCRQRFDQRHLEVDHIVPWSDEGSELFDNKQLLCSSCNRIKGDRPQEYLMQTLRERGIR